MTYPALTAFYAALLALIFVGLSCWTVARRVSAKTLHGDGGDKGLLLRVRSHGNFAEHVPFVLLLIALLEAGGASAALVRTLLVVLVIARLMHPFGMFAAPNSPRQFIFRGGGVILTALIFLVTAVTLLIRLA